MTPSPQQQSSGREELEKALAEIDAARTPRDDLRAELVNIWAKRTTSALTIEEMLTTIDQYTNTRVAEAEKAARVDENQQIIDAVDKNHADRYPKIVEGQPLTYVDHGYAVACKTFKRNAQARIAHLTKAKEEQGEA